jgi:hypothetical protein
VLYGQPEAINSVSTLCWLPTASSACPSLAAWWGGWWAEPSNSLKSTQKKQGATGITTVAPYIAGQWGRGNNRLF